MLLFSVTVSKRLQYICKFIFEEQWGMAFTLTTDSQKFAEHSGPKINYSNIDMGAQVFTISNHSLLFQQNRVAQPIECFDFMGTKAFFKTEANSHFGFDVLAASFYLLSRYEEYLPHQKDSYGRFAHENSLAFKEGFLHQPIINQWLKLFAAAVQKHFPAIVITTPAFRFLPTYDIDIAWSYRHKGLLRNLGGFFKKPDVKRWLVLLGLQPDPFDCYDYLHQLHSRFGLQPVYFFLVAASRSQYDKNISPYAHAQWQLMKRHAKKYRTGLHPSWQSNFNAKLIAKEKKILETATAMQINRSRQHYIKMELPQTYRRLLAAGITHDYSMGYGSINGFRASVASPFYWYNLEEETATSLIIHPFCFMDANAFYEQKQDAAQSLLELMQYYRECKNVNGELITIFHNSFLGTDPLYSGWKEMYEQFLENLLIS